MRNLIFHASFNRKHVYPHIMWCLLLAVLYPADYLSPYEGACQALTITVDDDGPADFNSIQPAIDAAVNGDTVIVADGLYIGPGNRQLDFFGKAITVQSENGAQTCIIDCEKQGRGFYFHLGEGNTSVVDGFTITNGSEYQGGAVHCYNHSSPTITNCIIQGNSSSSYGGGIYCREYSSPIITNCTIRGNSAGSYGGGIFCEDYSSPEIVNCIIQDNSTNSYGGGIYCRDYGSPTITNCVIQGNSTGSYGGGIYCDDCSGSITNCTIAGNSSNFRAGGIYFRDSSLTVVNCEITNNWTDDEGGGIYLIDSSPTIINCTFTGNSSDWGGGAIYVYRSSPIITNCTFNGNSAYYQGGGVYCAYQSMPVITNSIFSDCSMHAIYEGSSSCSPTVKFCLFYDNYNGDYRDYGTYETYFGAVQINALPGAANNVDGDPLFAFPDDTHIMHGSACIDWGTNDPPGGLPDTDKDGNPRILYGGRGRFAYADIGAYEYNSQEPLIALSPSTLEFIREKDGPNPGGKELLIRSCGGKVLNWQVNEDCPWLAVEPAIGDSTSEIDDIIVRVTTDGLPRGVYTYMLTVSDANAVNSPRPIWVTLRIKGTLYVPEQYPSIQGAIDASMDGETIQVAPGTYNEYINVDKQLELRGITTPRQMGPLINADGTYGNVVTLNADGCFIDSFRVIGGFTGIRVNSSNNIISNNIVSASNQGIELSYGSGNTLSNNEIHNNTLKGLFLNYSGGNILRENNIAGSPANFDLNGRSLSEYRQDIDISNTVDGKPIYYLVDKNDAAVDSSTNAGCVFVVNCTDVVVYDLELSDNGTGVVFAYTQNSNIENVTAVNNSRAGILLQNSTNNRLMDNNVSNNNYGIQLLNSGNDTLRGNVCTDNLYNFICDGGSLADYQHDIDISNTVDGKPIYYLVGKYSDTVDAASNAGCVFAVNCSNVTVRDLTVNRNGTGVTFVGTSNSSIENVTSTGNSQAGILLFNSTNTTLLGSSISGNYYGVSLLSSNYALLQSNYIFENSLGVSCNMGSLNLINTIIKNNSDEGAVAFFDNSIGSVVNCTIYGNSRNEYYYPYDGGGIYCDYSSSVTVSSSIICANRPNQITEEMGNVNVTVKYSNVQGQFQGIGNNIDENPMLTPDGHLRAGSPCIDKGEPYVVYTKYDMDGENRVRDVRVDIGADEYIDIDGDGLPDWWENEYFDPNNVAAEPDDDPDDDGHINLSEYQLYSSDPTVPCAIYYVGVNQPGDSNDGQSWETAKKTIQAAIEIAENSDKVLIAPGLYSQNISTLGRQIIIQSADPVDPTVVASTIINGGLSINRGELQGCIISGLTISNQYDTGILCQGTSPTISNCTITGNRSNSWERGGGITCLSASPIIANCIINGNLSPERGGGIYCLDSALAITNCVICGNLPYYGSGQGAAIYASNSNLEVRRCTIANNEYPDYYSTYGSVIYCEQGNLHLDNSILWNNLDLQVSCDDTIVTVTYSDIKGGGQGIQAYWDGYGNIEVDPCFVSMGYWTEPPYYYNATWVDGNYHLQSQGWRWIPNITHGTNWVWDGQTSRCIDAGNPGSELGDEVLTVSVDPDKEWGRNVRVNMGAYGGTAQASMAPHDWAVLGDLNNDGTVDLTDFARWVDNTMFWMIDENRGDCPADLDRNVSVNMTDLALLAQDWLAQTSWFGTNVAVQPPFLSSVPPTPQPPSQR